MTTPVRRVHRPGKYIPKARELPAPELPVADDTEDDVTERMTRIVPVARPARMPLPAPRTPVRLRKPEVSAVPDVGPAPSVSEERQYEAARASAYGLEDFGSAPCVCSDPNHFHNKNLDNRAVHPSIAAHNEALDQKFLRELAEDEQILDAEIARMESSDAPPDAKTIETFHRLYDRMRARARIDVREMLDPDDVPLEAKEAIAELEGELADEIAALAASTAKTRVTIAEKGMRSLEGVLYFVKNGVPELAKTGLELMNLNTKEKAYAALLEIIPTVSFWYAVTGKRLKFKEGAGWSQPELEGIDTIDRLMYLAGSVVFVGHVYSGIRHALASKGVFALARQGRIFAAARALIPEAAKLVGPTVARAQQYGIRQLTKDRTEPPVRSSQPEDRS
ncbi:MAG: hypothetical protein AAB663_02345 [Patescibacteria group bacterium]